MNNQIKVLVTGFILLVIGILIFSNWGKPESELEKTNVPFHFLWGEFDTLFPSETPKYLQTINPSIKYDLVKKCGHAPHVEKPLTLARMILSIYKENRHLRTRWNQW